MFYLDRKQLGLGPMTIFRGNLPLRNFSHTLSRLGDRGSIPDRGRDILSSPPRPSRL